MVFLPIFLAAVTFVWEPLEVLPKLHCLPAGLSPARLPRQAGKPAEKDFREWELAHNM
jgi:hypothetical protein